MDRQNRTHAIDRERAREREREHTKEFFAGRQTAVLQQKQAIGDAAVAEKDRSSRVIVRYSLSRSRSVDSVSGRESAKRSAVSNNCSLIDWFSNTLLRIYR